MSSSEIKVMLVDDHRMVRQGLIFFLSAQPGIRVIGEASTVKDAIDQAKILQPDVILMDLMLPDGSGTDAIEAILADSPAIQIIALSSFVDESKVRNTIEAGVAGYLMKDIDPVELATAIRATFRGEMHLHPEAARYLSEIMRPKSTDDREPEPSVLTARELEILAIVAQGLSNQDIADMLSISLKTVKVHVSNILQKLRLDSRVQAALYAVRHHIVTIDGL